MTICDTTKGSGLAYKKAFEHFGFEYKEEYVKQFLGEPLKVSFDRHNDKGVSFDDFEPYFYDCSDELIPPNATYFPDAKQLIETLKSFKKPMAIVTNKNRSTLTLILKKFELENNFQEILSVEDVRKIKDGAEKGDGIIECLKRFNISDKKDAIYIGDAQNDIIAANKAAVDYFCVPRSQDVKIDGKTWESLTYLSVPLLLKDLLNPQLKYLNKFDVKKDFNKGALIQSIISTHGKFRRGAKVGDKTLEDIRKKVDDAIANKRPISFSVPFGAYKGWQIDSNGEPDWGEIFNLEYYYAYAQEIANNYEYGVVINYTYQDKLMSYISNRPFDVLTKYVAIYEQLLKRFSGFNDKIKFKLVSINDLYVNDEAYFGEFVENLFDKILDVISNLYDGDSAKIPYKHFVDLMLSGDTEKAIDLVHNSNHSIFCRLQSGINNYCITGYNEKNDFSDKEEKEKIMRGIVSAMMIDAVDSLKLRRQFNKFSTNIQLVFDKKPALSLFVGATKSSVKSFWTGTGVLIKDGEEISPTIISQKEWQDIKNGCAVKISGGNVGKKYRIEQIQIDCEISDICDNYKCVSILVPII
jgi:phosphoglycolate phosphatase-like HAD superfamily hydrolase